MKPSNNYLPYILAAFFPIFSVINHQLIHKSGVLLVIGLNFLAFLGLWRFIERLVTVSEHRLIRWASIILGTALYITAYVSLDHYFLHLTLSVSGFDPLSMGIRMFWTALVFVIFIEGIRWSEARQKARIENLRLQAEVMETKFQLLREQVNPEFLFYCLKTLKIMVKSGNPQTEQYILCLANVYRQTLKTEQNLVQLEEELDLLRAYLFLMQYGRERALSLEIEVSPKSLHYQLPVFALQMLADNCIKHSAFSESQPLIIRVFQKDEKSVTMTYSHELLTSRTLETLNIEHLSMRYEIEDIEDAVEVEKGVSMYLITLKLI